MTYRISHDWHMSTVGDKMLSAIQVAIPLMKKTMPQTNTLRMRDSEQTRERILAAARARFSQASYENVGTRDIAGDAGVDAALVNRYFGGKEKLFAAAIEGGFHIEEHLPKQLDELGSYLVAQVMNDADDTDAFDALRVLLRAAGNPAIAPMVSERFHVEFIKPLARLLPGRDTEVRATMIASYVIGLAAMRHGLNSPALRGAARRKAVALAAASIQACVS